MSAPSDGVDAEAVTQAILPGASKVVPGGDDHEPTAPLPVEAEPVEELPPPPVAPSTLRRILLGYEGSRPQRRWLAWVSRADNAQPTRIIDLRDATSARTQIVNVGPEDGEASNGPGPAAPEVRFVDLSSSGVDEPPNPPKPPMRWINQVADAQPVVDLSGDDSPVPLPPPPAPRSEAPLRPPLFVRPDVDVPDLPDTVPVDPLDLELGDAQRLDVLRARLVAKTPGLLTDTAELDRRVREAVELLDDLGIAVIDDAPLPKAVGLIAPLDVDYEILERCSGGGQAVVYKVRHLPSGQLRALKLYNPNQKLRAPVLKKVQDLANDRDRDVARFFPQVFDFGMTEGDPERHIGPQYYEVLEFFEAGTLDDLRRRFGRREGTQQVLGPVMVRAVVTELARVLVVLTAQGLAHRDLKPANVMIRSWPTDASGTGLRLVLVDWGTGEADGRLTLTGAANASFQYTCLEVFGIPDGYSWEVIDYWALGVIAGELASGQVPYPAGVGFGVFRRLLDPAFHLGFDYVPDDRIRALCRGLTRKHLPDRWGADEVAAWLGGQNPEVAPDPDPEGRQGGVIFNGHRYFDRVSLARALGTDWRSAVMLVASGPSRDTLRSQLIAANLFSDDIGDLFVSWAGQSRLGHPDREVARLVVALNPEETEPLIYGRRVDPGGLPRVAGAACSGDRVARSVLDVCARPGVLTVFAKLPGNGALEGIEDRFRSATSGFEQACRAGDVDPATAPAWVRYKLFEALFDDFGPTHLDELFDFERECRWFDRVLHGKPAVIGQNPEVSPAGRYVAASWLKPRAAAEVAGAAGRTFSVWAAKVAALVGAVVVIAWQLRANEFSLRVRLFGTWEAGFRNVAWFPAWTGVIEAAGSVASPRVVSAVAVLGVLAVVLRTVRARWHLWAAALPVLAAAVLVPPVGWMAWRAGLKHREAGTTSRAMSGLRSFAGLCWLIMAAAVALASVEALRVYPELWWSDQAEAAWSWLLGVEELRFFHPSVVMDRGGPAVRAAVLASAAVAAGGWLAPTAHRVQARAMLWAGALGCLYVFVEALAVALPRLT